jgi:energy-coupling factor transport system substrate-specific component
MSRPRPHFFTLHELLIMAALAALGGVSGSAVSLVGAAVHAAIGLPGGLQFMAGIHVLWLILAIGLIRKPGTATVTAVLKGVVELLSGNPHGLIVVLLSGLGGVVVDLVWLLAARRDRLGVYLAAGGFGAASNLLVFKLMFSLPSNRAVTTGLWVLAGVAFASGVLLAGLLGWSLMHALRRAGVVGTQRPTDDGPAAGPAAAPARLGAGAIGGLVVLTGVALYLFFMASQDGAAGDATSEMGPVESSSTR